MTEKQLPCPSFLTTKTLDNFFFFLAIKFLGQMVDFSCCHSPEVVVLLKGEKKSLFLDPGPKNGASNAPNWDVWGLQARVSLSAPKHSLVH